MGRRTPAVKSEALKEDAELWQEATRLAAWLSTRDLNVLTAPQVLAFAQTVRPDATLTREAVTYEWIWDEKEHMWLLVCIDRATVSLPGTSPIDIHFDVSARY